MKRNIKIVATAKHLPDRKVYSSEIDQMIGTPTGWAEKKSGVKVRHYVQSETATEMGTKAATKALEKAGLSIHDIDCIVSTSGTYEQPIPCSAALLHEKLCPTGYSIPAFDINSTCLSFVTGLDMMSYSVDAGRFKRVLLVSAEISSVGINYTQNESAVLFGDGAVAVIIEQTPANETSHIIVSHMQTFSEGAHTTEIRGGGTKMHPREHNESTKEEFLFDMDGRGVFRLTSKVIVPFFNEVLEKTQLDSNDLRLVIPHQASAMAMRIIRQKLNIPEEKFMSIIETHGNVIAASIPLALHEAIEQNKLQRGDKVMLLGSSAGLSLGGIILEY